MSTIPSNEPIHNDDSSNISRSDELEMEGYLSGDLNVRVKHLASEHTFSLLGSFVTDTVVRSSTENDIDTGSNSFYEELANDVKECVPNVERISARLSISRWVLLISVLALAIPFIILLNGLAVSSNDHYIVGLLIAFPLLSAGITCLTMLHLSMIKDHYYETIAKAALVKSARDTQQKNRLHTGVDLIIEDIEKTIVHLNGNQSVELSKVLTKSVLQKLKSIRTGMI